MNRPTAIQLLAQAALSATGFLVPVLAAALGANLVEVGLVAASYGLAQFLASAAGGRWADAHGRRRVLKIGLGAATVGCLLPLAATTPAALALARGAFGFAAGAFPPALLSIAYDRNRKLGRFTGWGSLGFAVGASIGALVALAMDGMAAVRAVFVVASGLFAVAFAIGLTIRLPPEHNVVVHLWPAEVIHRNAPAYAAILLRHVGAAAVWVVFPLFLLDLGAPLAWVGFVHAANGLAQFVLMPRMDAYRPIPLVVAGCLLSALTFGGFLVAETVLHYLLLQPLLAASWACLYMGALKYVLDHKDEERATATGLLQSSIQLSNVAGPAVGGLLAWAAGYRATFVFAILMSLAATGLFLWEVRATRRARAPAAAGTGAAEA